MKELFFFPVLKLDENDEWQKYKGEEVGRVLPDGSIENTDYQFDPDTICGGIAIANHQVLLETSKDHAVNPATGTPFSKTRKGTGYFSRDGSRIWGRGPHGSREI